MEWLLGGPFSELYPMTPRANQDGRHSGTEFNIGLYGKFIKKSSRLELLAQLNQTFLKLSWNGPLSELYPMTPPANQDGRQSGT